MDQTCGTSLQCPDFADEVSPRTTSTPRVCECSVPTTLEAAFNFEYCKKNTDDVTSAQERFAPTSCGLTKAVATCTANGKCAATSLQNSGGSTADFDADKTACAVPANQAKCEAVDTTKADDDKKACTWYDSIDADVAKCAALAQPGLATCKDIETTGEDCHATDLVAATYGADENDCNAVTTPQEIVTHTISAVGEETGQMTL